MKRPYVLSIAGFDPSSGAGISSDIKTLEQNKVYGLGVVTSVTYQNESEFIGLDWLSIEKIKQQLQALAVKYTPACIKIGLIQSEDCLSELLDWLKETWPEAFIIWDPILKASAGFSFHANLAPSIKSLISGRVDLITPNIPEYTQLFGKENPQLIVDELECHLLLKGGHTQESRVCDELYSPNKTSYKITSDKVKGDWQKHGTGCVLSSAISAELAKGEDLQKACYNSHFYVKSFIASNHNLLGHHSYNLYDHE
ncbi:hydroxymethylpyrimidine/phosphomethylpyrimidine kinase [Carboxylicivirga sp. N1Y90]|uniref:hydroxymethylpyrimidine/phosphomethylpyrimidine kinase n=1 Tax=Carboxylicivirga fragile TaxID=3417571 RepID=UPI003D353FDC|nr:hydroxymethylpyrimidine/phosphomethylpyrimidine kinase [Marinilabiliaceae bacterium N1Y90]